MGITPPLKWHGGKHYLADLIISLMPPHMVYVEPFCGGCQVLLARDPGDRSLWVCNKSPRNGVNEIVNDINRHLTNFWRVLQRAETFEPFRRIIQTVPFSQVEWEDAGGRLDHPDPVEAAVAFFIRCRQSLAGRMDAFTGVTKTRTRGGRNAEVNAWMSAIGGLTAVCQRLRNVLILNRPAVEVIRKYDTPDTLFYCDPFPSGEPHLAGYGMLDPR
jgi:DNA adenine methylase